MNDFQSTWHSNRGGLLLAIASLASVVISGVWYFDLLPDLEIVTDDFPGNVTPAVAASQTFVFVTVSAAEYANQDPPITALIRVHSPFGQFGSNTTELDSREFQIIDSRAQTYVFSDLQPGQYAVSVFLDMNANRLLDFEAETPQEPVQLSVINEVTSGPIELESASITLGRGQARNLRFDF